MTIENETLFEDVMSIGKQRKAADIWKFEAEVIAGDITVAALRVNRLLNMRDYVRGYTDSAVVNLSVGIITYMKKIYPNRNNLTIKIKRTRRSEFGSEVREGDVSYTTYKATLSDSPDIDMLAKTKDMTSYNEMELNNQLDLNFQLMEDAIYSARLAEFGGIFREASLEDILKVGMGYGLSSSTNTSSLTADDYSGVKGVSVTAPTNSGSKECVSIPVGTRIVTLPDYLQKEYGLYSSEAGCYFQNGFWYVFPIYDFTLYSRVPKTLTIVNLEEDQIAAMTRTYKVEGKKVSILAIGDSKIKDDSESSQLNTGNGLRYVRAGSIMDKMTTTSENKTDINRADTLKEFLIAERKDSLNNVRYVDKVITNNPYPSISKLTKGLGLELTLTWQNSNNSLLYPGMPVKLLYMKGGIVREAIGTLIGTETIITTKTTGITDNDYTSNSNLKVFVKKTEE